MKKALKGLFTIIFSCMFVYVTKRLVAFLSKTVPYHYCCLIYLAVVAILEIVYVKLFLGDSFKDYYISKLRFHFSWFATALLLPAVTYCAFYFLNARWTLKIISSQYIAEYICCYIVFAMIVREFVVRSVIFGSMRTMMSKGLSAVVLALAIGILSIRNYQLPILEMLKIFSFNFSFALLLNLVTIHSENIFYSTLISIIYTLFSNVFALESSMNTWLELAVKVGCFCVFIVLALILLGKKRKQEVLYW